MTVHLDSRPRPTHQYRPEVLARLASHGLFPRAWTPPALVHEFLSDLYRFEIRRLKRRLVSGEFPLRDYASRVIELRRRYPLIPLPPQFWVGPPVSR